MAKKVIGCKKCGDEDVYYGRMCKNCYEMNQKNLCVCIVCGEIEKHGGFGVCKNCYPKFYKKVDVCIGCKELKKIQAKRLCLNCYNKDKNNVVKSS